MKKQAKRAALALLFLLAAAYLILRFTPLPPLLEGMEFSREVLDRQGELLYLTLTPDEKYRLYVRLKEIPQEAVRDLLLYEDRYFYQHPGINPFSVLRATSAMLAGGRRLGASTLTMQTARMRYRIASKSVMGKLRQMFTALCLEARYTKDEILEAYFNLAPYGGCVEGIGAAALAYFHRPVWRLTKTELLALIPVPQNPARRSPSDGVDFESARARLTALCAKDRGLSNFNVPPLKTYSASALPFEAPHSVREALRLAPKGMRRIQTSLDLPLQKKLQNLITRYTERGAVYGVNNAALLLLHAPSSEIHALIGSADFFNEDIAGQVDGTLARRSPGSTLKPFIYALALEQGLIHPQTLLLDSKRSFGGYDPENFDHSFRGPIHAADALKSSRNIPAISLASKLRNPKLYDFLVRAGISFPYPEEHYGLSLVLGGAEVSMQELAGLYAMLLNRGILTRPTLLPQKADRHREYLLLPEAAYVVLRMLEQPGLALRGKNGQKLPLRYKTGTSNGFHDAWCVGVLGPYVLAVWAGDFANRSGARFVGGEHAVPLWLEAAEALAAESPLVDPLPAIREELHLLEIPVCAQTGDTDTSLCSETVNTLFIPGVSPIRPTGFLRRILVDRETGLRACTQNPETTEEVVAEFWPTEFRELFRQAGIYKSAPPEFMPGCNGASNADKAPIILQPQQGVIYYRRLSATEPQPIPFKAGTAADAKEVYWFAGSTFLGKTRPGETMFWELPPGTYSLRASDEHGRGAVQTLIIQAVP